MDKPLIVFSGGGTMGHLAPAIAVADALKSKLQYEPFFICSPREQEQTALRSAGYTFATLSAPKFPRGLSFGWIAFPFHFLAAFMMAGQLLTKRSPALIFSKGGFISVPVCLAAHIRSIPIVLHESDTVQGLGNRLIARIAKQICRGFPAEHLKPREIFTGNPVRSLIKTSATSRGLLLTGFSGRRPIVMILGGSQGAESLNTAVRDQIDALLDLADVIHLTGPGKTGASKQHARYFVREFVTAELGDLYSIADIVVTRAGAGTISELAALKKAAILVPIVGLANDHQVVNAEYLASHNAAQILPQTDLPKLAATLSILINDTARRKSLGEGLHALFPDDASERIAAVLLDALPAPR